MVVRSTAGCTPRMCLSGKHILTWLAPDVLMYVMQSANPLVGDHGEYGALLLPRVSSSLRTDVGAAAPWVAGAIKIDQLSQGAPTSGCTNLPAPCGFWSILNPRAVPFKIDQLRRGTDGLVVPLGTAPRESWSILNLAQPCAPVSSRSTKVDGEHLRVVVPISRLPARVGRSCTKLQPLEQTSPAGNRDSRA